MSGRGEPGGHRDRGDMIGDRLPEKTMFKLITTVRGGAVNAPAAYVQYASADEAREAAKALMHEHQRVVRVMIVEEPSRFVEWMDRG